MACFACRHGDSDRYLPAILYGCVPVFVKEREAAPFQEVIDWTQISLKLEPKHVPIMYKVIANFSQDRIVGMRRAMGNVWMRLLWTAARRKPFLGETGRQDAFATLIEVLRRRLTRECGL
jgi:hypothetical protein